MIRNNRAVFHQPEIPGLHAVRQFKLICLPYCKHCAEMIDLLVRVTGGVNDAYNKGDQAGDTMIIGRAGMDAIVTIEFRE